MILESMRLWGGIDEGRVALRATGDGSLSDLGVDSDVPTPARTLWRIDTRPGRPEKLTRVSSEEDADLVSSLTEDGGHAPALDIDITMSTRWDSERPGRVTYAFSSWEQRLPRDGYLALLRVARDLGLVAAEWYLRRVRRVERGATKYLGAREDAALEICVPSFDVASSTSGHSHIYIEHELSWPAYARLLDALQGARVLRGRFHEMAMRRQMTLLLTPARSKAEMKARLGAEYGS